MSVYGFHAGSAATVALPEDKAPAAARGRGADLLQPCAWETSIHFLIYKWLSQRETAAEDSTVFKEQVCY